MKKTLSIFISCLFLFQSCSQDSAEFKTSDKGLKYKFINKNKEGKKAKQGDVLVMKMSYKTEFDSMLFHTKEMGGTINKILDAPSFDGACVENAFAMLLEKDSMQFMINTNDFYTKTLKRKVPEFAERSKNLIFNVKLIKIKTKEEIVAEKKRLHESNSQEEMRRLKNYLIQEDIKIKPKMSGLYFIEKQKGTGQNAMPNDKVKVHYIGKFINGMVFDSSVERAEIFEFILGKDRVIDAWQEGISYMKKGSKATFIVPSHLAYKAKGVENVIPPYATLIFEVELLDIIKSE